MVHRKYTMVNPESQYEIENHQQNQGLGPQLVYIVADSVESSSLSMLQSHNLPNQ
jgi:hypothetical protein